MCIYGDTDVLYVNITALGSGILWNWTQKPMPSLYFFHDRVAGYPFIHFTGLQDDCHFPWPWSDFSPTQKLQSSF